MSSLYLNPSIYSAFPISPFHLSPSSQMFSKLQLHLLFCHFLPDLKFSITWYQSFPVWNTHLYPLYLTNSYSFLGQLFKYYFLSQTSPKFLLNLSFSDYYPIPFLSYTLVWYSHVLFLKGCVPSRNTCPVKWKNVSLSTIYIFKTQQVSGTNYILKKYLLTVE